MRAILEVSTDYGYDVAIYEEDLEGITASELWKLRISRPVLKRCFGEGVMLMQGKTENDRVRPCAYPISGGKQWVVHLVQYPGRSDPLTSFWNEKGSNATPSDSDDCNIS